MSGCMMLGCASPPEDGWLVCSAHVVELGLRCPVDRLCNGGACCSKHAQQTRKDTTMDPDLHVMQFFAYGHLPEPLQKVSKLFGDLAVELVADLPQNPELTKALDKLLEAKDCAVRARLAKAPAATPAAG